MRAARWPVASLRVPHGGVDGRAGGVRNVQAGQQRAHVQGIGVSDEDLTEDRGVGGKQYALPGGGGGEEWEDVRGPRRGGEHDVGWVCPQSGQAEEVTSGASGRAGCSVHAEVGPDERVYAGDGGRGADGKWAVSQKAVHWASTCRGGVIQWRGHGAGGGRRRANRTRWGGQRRGARGVATWRPGRRAGGLGGGPGGGRRPGGGQGGEGQQSVCTRGSA